MKINTPQLIVNVNDCDYLKVENRIEYTYCARNLVGKKNLPQQSFEVYNSPKGSNSFQINFNGLYEEPKKEEFGNNDIYNNNEFICTWLKN
jgi:hypothetical protein